MAQRTSEPRLTPSKSGFLPPSSPAGLAEGTTHDQACTLLSSAWNILPQVCAWLLLLVSELKASESSLCPQTSKSLHWGLWNLSPCHPSRTFLVVPQTHPGHQDSVAITSHLQPPQCTFLPLCTSCSLCPECRSGSFQNTQTMSLSSLDPWH